MTFGTLHVIGLIAALTLLLWAILFFIFYFARKFIANKKIAFAMFVVGQLLMVSTPFLVSAFIVDTECGMIISYHERQMAK